MSEKSQEIFNKALRNFAMDAACGDAIRRLADKGMTVSEITRNLTFPTPVENVRRIVWEHYINKGIILLNEPDENMGCRKEISYVEDRDSYGRRSFRRVEKEVKEERRKYHPCDYGRMLYKEDDRFIGLVNKLEPSDRDYIMNLPWPLERVWHVDNDRMTRIMNIMGDF